jgi:enamine deaminase RidA (YjgF/YER057c/UK114 family)
MTVQFLSPAMLSKPTGYSHVAIVDAGKQIHISGQVALNAAGEVVGKGDVGAQAEQVYANLITALAAAGASLGDVFKLVTYVVNLTPEKAAAIRAVRMKHLGAGPYPASTMVGVTSLVTPDLLVEIEVIATGS